jgi:beta-glucosidase
MTLEEKIGLLHGGTEASPSGVGQAGTWPGLPRLGIPSLRLTDGPPGISIGIWSTGMTATMGLAATWSREDAKKNGVVIGRDARTLGQDVVLQPFVNLVRDFEFGRAYNTFGEDPFLTGQIAVAQVQGTQGEGVMSQAKHFVGYDGGNDVYVDPQTLREIYIAQFVDLANAGVSSIMCSYNKINGLQACDNNEIQNIILRGEDGFRGFNTSDWGATHGTLNIANGLDMEMPGGSYTAADPGGGGRGGGGMPEERATGGAGGGRGAGGGPGRGGDPPAYGMLKAVQDGLIREQQISLAVGRVLLQMDKFGYLDKAPKHTITEIDSAFNAPILQKTAEDAATLLKNEDTVLPLSAADLDSTAFIGPTGGILVSIGISGEKAMGLPDHQVGPVPAIEKIAGRKVTYAVANDFDGKPIPASNLSNLVRTNTAGSQTQNDSQIDFTNANSKALPPGTSYTWKGTLNIPADGTYMLALQTRGTTGSVTLDGAQVVGGGGGGRGFGGGGAPGGAAGVPAPGAILPGGAAPGAAMPAAPGGGRGGQGGPPLASLPDSRDNIPSRAISLPRRTASTTRATRSISKRARTI